MPKRSSTSLHWLTLAVLLPLGVLASLAWWGTRTQLKAAWTDARAEAERMAPLLAQSYTAAIESEIATLPTYPDPPVPGQASELDAILDGKDLAALEAIRDNPEAGISPAGLPRRALAAMRLHELDRWRQSRNYLSDFLSREVPSTLTETALKRPDLLHGQMRWREAEKIRDLAKKVRDPDGEWLQDETGHPLFIRNQGTALAYFPAPGARRTWDEHKQGLPRWAFTHTHLGKPQEPTWPILATVPVGPGKGLFLSISPYGYGDLLEAPIRRQQRWIFAMLAGSLLTAFLALFFIHRTLRRERQLNDMKSQFVASVSHELRAPVASIRLMADALEAEKVAPETAREFHRLIAREGARLSTLVGNVLDHARIEQGRRVWKMEPCDLESLVADTLRVMEPLAREKNITLRSVLSPLEAAVDAGAIQQALVNLLDNAIKFSPAGCTVETTLSVDEERRTWHIAVRDEGPGIAKAEQARIFERFYRPGDELRRETQGTGIGLSLVKAIAEAHGGSVTVESEPGQGSIFTLVFPQVLPLITDH